MTVADLATAYLQGRNDRQNSPRRPRRSALSLIAGWAGRHIPAPRQIRTATLQTAALTLADIAVFDTWGRGAGLAAVSISLFILEYLTGEDRSRR